MLHTRMLAARRHVKAFFHTITLRVDGAPLPLTDVELSVKPSNQQQSPSTFTLKGVSLPPGKTLLITMR